MPEPVHPAGTCVMPERQTTEPPVAPQSHTDRVPPSRVVVFCLIALLGATADLITKELTFRHRGLPGEKPVLWVVDGVLGIETAVNTGAVFGIGAGKGTLFATLSVLAGIAILIWLFWFREARSWWLTIALGMVTGGILGNLYDRLGMWWQEGMPVEWKSGVRDWILMQAGDAYKWPNYNIADSLLVIGAVMLVWRSFSPQPEPEDSTPQASPESRGSGKAE